MSDAAITVENLGKKYNLRHQVNRDEGLRHVLQRALTAPFRRASAQPPVDEAKEEFWALREVNFEVKRGEVVGVIGRNGAGKSTLLKVLSRITEPTTGRIEIEGRVASLLEVGTGFHPELTGRENIYLNGTILGMTRREIARKFDEIVAFAEVEKFLDTPVKHYSSGMYVRLAFAVAAHLEPDILIVDEVLAVGDAQFQKKCLGRMKDVSVREGRTVLFVSHNMGAVTALCERALLLRSGQVEAMGPTAEIARRYLANSGPGHSEISLQSRTNWNPGITVTGGQLLRRETPSAKFIHGDDLTIILEIETKTAMTYGIEFFLKDELGAPLGFAPSDLQNGLVFSSPGGRSVHRCNLASLPLVEGRYSFDIMISNPLMTAHEMVENAFLFDVETSTFPGTTRRLRQQDGQGPLILKFQFEPPRRESAA
jgi:lipopolysaccharide transport system ATP-binding protein